MRKLLNILAWTFGIVLGLLAIFVGHANYRIANDEVNTIDAEAPGRFIAAQGHRLHVQTIGDVDANTRVVGCGGPDRAGRHRRAPGA